MKGLLKPQEEAQAAMAAAGNTCKGITTAPALRIAHSASLAVMTVGSSTSMHTMGPGHPHRHTAAVLARSTGALVGVATRATGSGPHNHPVQQRVGCTGQGAAVAA